jgi:hypothetical protein
MPEPTSSAIEIRELGPGDVGALIACVERCYGGSYSISGFYDPDWVRSELASGRLLSIGACVGPRVVGHIGTSVPSPGDPVGDAVAAIVEPASRGQGLLFRMGHLLFEGYRHRGIVATRHFATGAHLRTQRPLAASGAVETGVLLGHLPAATEYRGIGQPRLEGARIGAVVFFQSYGELGSLDVHVAARYRAGISEIYRRAGLVRRIVRAAPERRAGASGTPVASVSARHDERVGVSIVRFSADPDCRLDPQRLGTELPRRLDVAYVDVPLCHRDGPHVVEWLRRRGFVFGAVLPGTSSSEHLRMQRVSARTIRPELIQLATPASRRLRDWILADFDRHAGHD